VLGALLLVVLPLAGATAQVRQRPVHRTAVDGDVTAVLERVAITGPNPAALLARFRVTDRIGRPLELVRGAMLSLPELRRRSDPRIGVASPSRPGELNLVVDGLPASTLKRAVTLVLELRAARAGPTRVWDAPLDPRGIAALPVHRDGDVEAHVVRFLRGAAGGVLGGATAPTITVEVAETLRPGAPPGAGMLRLDGVGLRQTQASHSRRGAQVLYEATARVTGDAVPERVRVRYYSGPGAVRALKPHRFKFHGIRPE